MKIYEKYSQLLGAEHFAKMEGSDFAREKIREVIRQLAPVGSLQSDGTYVKLTIPKSVRVPRLKAPVKVRRKLKETPNPSLPTLVGMTKDGNLVYSNSK